MGETHPAETKPDHQAIREQTLTRTKEELQQSANMDTPLKPWFEEQAENVRNLRR